MSQKLLSITEKLNNIGEPINMSGQNTLATTSIAVLAATIGAAVATALFSVAKLTPFPVTVSNPGNVNIPSPLSVSGAVSVANFPSPVATQTVNGSVNIGNFPTPIATQPVSGTVSIQGIPSPLPVNGSVSVLNFPSPVATQTVNGSVTVGNFPSPVATQTVNGALSISNFPATQPISTAALTATSTSSASIALVSVQVVGANAARKSFLLWNNSSNSTYCCFAATCSSASPANIIATFTTWIFTLPYTGAISCIRNAGSGNVTVTELQ